LAELHRALHRTGRTPSPGATLLRLESILGGRDAAAAYLRVVRSARYAASPARPTAAQRRALRSELGPGLGAMGRLRAWWAPPPRRAIRWRWRRACGPTAATTASIGSGRGRRPRRPDAPPSRPPRAGPAAGRAPAASRRRAAGLPAPTPSRPRYGRDGRSPTCG